MSDGETALILLLVVAILHNLVLGLQARHHANVALKIIREHAAWEEMWLREEKSFLLMLLRLLEERTAGQGGKKEEEP